MDHPGRAMLDELGALAISAGAVIMQHFGKAQAQIKSDGSPVTLADAQAEAIILPALAAICPGMPIIAEEAAAAGNIPDVGDSFILVDPLDGTKEFISGSPDFTVNIGLVHKRVPIGGVIYAPASGQLWMGGKTCEACEIAPGMPLASARNRRPVQVRSLPKTGLVVAASRSHRTPETADFIAALPVADTTIAGSSLKFCLIAEGKADVYPRFGPTMEWDTCAGHAILQAAGGEVRAPDGSPFLYGKHEQAYRNGSFVAVSDFGQLQAMRR